MIRRYNYTGRKSIDRSDVMVRIEEAPLRFRATLILASYGLPNDARVAIEAYRRTKWLRFDFGTVGALRPPADLLLADFDVREGILFRVRVTSATDPEGRLLAEADRISPSHVNADGSESREPLLPIQPADLREEVFRLDFTDRPLLLINNQLGDWRALAHNPWFICIALPQSLREILTRVLLVEKFFELDDEEDWRSRWLQFAVSLPGSPNFPKERVPDTLEDWLNDAVAAFTRMHGMKARFVSHWSGGADQ